MVFHLYFAGAQAMVSEELMEANSNYRLLSYWHDKKRIERRRDMGLLTFIDSGAFTSHTKGIEVDVDTYIDYLNERIDSIDCAAQVDEIPGTFGLPKSKKDLIEAPIISWDNYLYMEKRVKQPEKILPVFHQFEKFKHFETMVNYGVPYIGISPSNEISVSQKIPWINECFKIIEKSGRTDVKIHAFGMTSLNVLEMYPFYSADSTSWLMTSANGAIMSKYGTIFVSERGIQDRKHIFNLSKETQLEIERYVNSLGYNLKDLSESYKERSNFNITYLTHWAKNYQYKPQTVKQFKLF